MNCQKIPHRFHCPGNENSAWIHQQLFIGKLPETSIHESNIAYLKNYQKSGLGNLHPKNKYTANPEIYFNILLVGPGNLMAMKDMGILIGCGTDSGVPLSYHGTLWRKVEC